MGLWGLLTSYQLWNFVGGFVKNNSVSASDHVY